MPVKQKPLTILDVDSATQELGFKVAELLRSRGWRHTSSNPACLWLWEKAIEDGRTLLVDQDTALAFERHTFTGEG